MRLIRPCRISGSIDAPPSKSLMQRAVIAAALADGESVISNPSVCDDSVAAMRVVKTLGASITYGEKGIRIRGGMGIRGPIKLDCSESGTCMRMIAAVAALRNDETEISGRGSLLKRPIGMIEEPLRALGASCSTDNGIPPIAIRGPMHGGKTTVDGSESSQFISGLLMALPSCKEDSEITVLELKSRAYVSMTEALLKKFGVKVGSEGDKFNIKGGQHYEPKAYRVDGDWSGSAFLLVAGAIAGDVEIRGLESGSQPDEEIVTVLKDVGAKVDSSGGAVRVERRELRSFEFDASGSPDLFPPLVALACSCDAKSVIHGISRLKHKESDRSEALAKEFGGMGADIKVIDDRMEINGKRLVGGVIDSHNDHRIAMACAVAGLVSERGVRIEDDSCVSKSYPGFFEELGSLVV